MDSQPQRVVSLLALSALVVGLGLLPAQPLGAQAPAAKAPAAELILPTETVALFSMPNVPATRDRWTVTQFGQLTSDPALQPFIENVKEQLVDRWALLGPGAGITFDELLELPTGEFAIAISRNKEGKSVMTLLADVTGNEEAANNLLQRAGQQLQKENAQRKQFRFREVRLVQYLLPKREQPARPRLEKLQQQFGLQQPTQVIQFSKDGMLVLTTDLQAAANLISRWAELEGSLQKQPGYIGTMTALRNDIISQNGDPEAPAADMQLFLDPIGYLRTQRADFPPEDTGEPDLLTVAEAEGFDRILGLGGMMHLERGDYDAVFRMAAFAPNLPKDQGVRLLTFPEGSEHTPPAWVPPSVPSYASFYWNTQTAFEGFGDIFDELFEEPGAFNDLIKSIAADPKGPKIDIRKDLVQLVGRHGYLLGNVEKPFDEGSRQQVVIFEVTQPDLLLGNITRSVKDDPNVKPITLAEKQAFLLYQDPTETGVPHDEQQPLVLIVARSHLMVASHEGIVELVLKEQPQPLQQVGWYQQVAGELKKVAPEELALWSAVNTQASVEPTYERLRAGKLRGAQSLLGRLLVELFGTDAKNRVRLQGELLPPYNQVRGYFGPVGVVGYQRPESGLFTRGVVLRPKAEQQAQPVVPADGEVGVAGP